MNSSDYSWIFNVLLVTFIVAQSTLARPNAQQSRDYLTNWKVMLKEKVPDCYFPPKDILIEENQSNDTIRLVSSFAICNDVHENPLCSYLLILPQRICNKNLTSESSDQNKNLTSSDIMEVADKGDFNICSQLEYLDSNFDKIVTSVSCKEDCHDSHNPLCHLVLYGVKLLAHSISLPYPELTHEQVNRKNEDITQIVPKTELPIIPAAQSLLASGEKSTNTNANFDPSHKLPTDSKDNLQIPSISSPLEEQKHISSFSKAPNSKNEPGNGGSVLSIASTEIRENSIKLAENISSPLTHASNKRNGGKPNIGEATQKLGISKGSNSEKSQFIKPPSNDIEIDEQKNLNKDMDFDIGGSLPSEPAGEEEINKMIPEITDGLDGSSIGLKNDEAEDEKDADFVNDSKKKNLDKSRLDEFERTRKQNYNGMSIGNEMFTTSDLNVEETNYLNYLIAFVGIVGILYLAFHNKKRLIAYLIEGKKPRNSRTRRSSSSSYRKLENNFD